MSMCRVFSCVFGKVFAITSAFSWQNSISLCPASFCSQKPNLPVTPGVSGEGNGTPLQYSSLENPMDGGAWKTAVHGVAEGRTRLSNFTFTCHFHLSHHWRKKWQPTPVFLPGESQGWGSLVGCRLWGAQSRT